MDEKDIIFLKINFKLNTRIISLTKLEVNKYF